MSVRFYFEFPPNSEEPNELKIEIDGVLRYTPCDRITHRGSYYPAWLTDEVCDRIGHVLASNRLHWLQYVEA
jgi:hypothetical protein